MIARHGDEVAARRLVPATARLLEKVARRGVPVAARAGKRLKKPQSWIYNCEAANRRVDVTEFVAWARACGVEPASALRRLLQKL